MSPEVSEGSFEEAIRQYKTDRNPRDRTTSSLPMPR